MSKPSELNTDKLREIAKNTKSGGAWKINNYYVEMELGRVACCIKSNNLSKIIGKVRRKRNLLSLVNSKCANTYIETALMPLELLKWKLQDTNDNLDKADRKSIIILADIIDYLDSLEEIPSGNTMCCIIHTSGLRSGYRLEKQCYVVKFFDFTFEDTVLYSRERISSRTKCVVNTYSDDFGMSVKFKSGLLKVLNKNNDSYLSFYANY